MGQRVVRELRDRSRRAGIGVLEGVEPRTDPVERPEERVPEALFLSVRGDHAVHELLGRAVDPPHLGDRPDGEGARVLAEFRVRAHAVHLGRRREDHAFPVRDAHPDDLEVLFEVQLERTHWVGDVVGRFGHPHQGQDDVVVAHAGVDPAVRFEDVAFREGESL